MRILLLYFIPFIAALFFTATLATPVRAQESGAAAEQRIVCQPTLQGAGAPPGVYVLPDGRLRIAGVFAGSGTALHAEPVLRRAGGGARAAEGLHGRAEALEFDVMWIIQRGVFEQPDTGQEILATLQRLSKQQRGIRFGFVLFSTDYTLEVGPIDTPATTQQRLQAAAARPAQAQAEGPRYSRLLDAVDRGLFELALQRDAKRARRLVVLSTGNTGFSGATVIDALRADAQFSAKEHIQVDAIGLPGTDEPGAQPLPAMLDPELEELGRKTFGIVTNQEGARGALSVLAAEIEGMQSFVFPSGTLFLAPAGAAQPELELELGRAIATCRFKVPPQVAAWFHDDLPPPVYGPELPAVASAPQPQGLAVRVVLFFSIFLCGLVLLLSRRSQLLSPRLDAFTPLDPQAGRYRELKEQLSVATQPQRRADLTARLWRLSERLRLTDLLPGRRELWLLSVINEPFQARTYPLPEFPALLGNIPCSHIPLVGEQERAHPFCFALRDHGGQLELIDVSPSTGKPIAGSSPRPLQEGTPFYIPGINSCFVLKRVRLR